MGSSKKQTVGYRYSLGMHQILTHGPVDKLTRYTVDERPAWLGTSTGGPVVVSAEGLFGGADREGGVSGTFDLEMGGLTQGPNAYLAGQLGGAIPSFRGVVGVVMRQMYLGNNPYLKKNAFRLQRIHTRQDGIAQWYDEKAEVLSVSLQTATYVWDRFDGPEWSTNAPTKFAVVSGGETITNTLVNGANTDYWRTPIPSFITRLYCVFRLIDRDQGDPLGIRFDTVDGLPLFSFMPQSEFAFDPLKRPAINYWDPAFDDTTVQAIYATELAETVAYNFEAIIDPINATVDYTLREGTTVLSQGSGPLPAGVPAFLTFGRTSNAFPAAAGVAGFDYVEITGGIPSGDMNPAHMIRECLTDPLWGMGYNEADIDDVSFMAAADKLFAEGMGMSLLWDRQMPIEQFVQEIVKHINAALYVGRRGAAAGKFVLKLIRGDYDASSLPVFDESNVDKVEGFKRLQEGELTNSVTVNYWNSATGKTASTTAQDPALVQQQGAVINTTMQYTGFTNQGIADRVALRDLNSLSTPLASCTIYTNESAKELNIGDVIALSWEDYALVELPMRITGMTLGDGKSSKIKMTVTQDVFALPEQGMIVPPDVGWEDPSGEPLPLVHQYAEELPYYELVQQAGQSVVDTQLATEPDAGMVCAAAARAQSDAINARLTVDDGAGYQDVGAVDFCPVAVLDVAAGLLDEQFVVSGVVDAANIATGSYAKLNGEYVRVDSLSGQYLNVKRGVLDTVPQTHAAGSVVFFSDPFIQYDPTEYVTSDVLDVKLLPATGRGVLAEGLAPVLSVTMNGRANRPYAPGNFKIENKYFPTIIANTGGVALTWAHRDRKLQTGGPLVSFKDGNVGPEAGVSYTLRIYGENNTLLRTVTGTTPSYTYPEATELADNGGVAGSPYETLINAQSPRGYWRLGEASGNFIDTVGSYVATLTGSPTRAVAGLLTGNADPAVTWTATTQYAATAADNRWLLGTGNFSVGTIVKFTGSSFATCLSIRVAGGITDMLVLLTLNRFVAGDISAETWDWGDANSRARSTGGKNDGNRHVVFATFNNTTKALKLYVDGTLVDTRTQAGTRPTTGNLTVWIGNNSNTAQGMSGLTQDEVALFNTELSAAVIAELSNTALNGAVSGRLSGELRFELESVRDSVVSWQKYNVSVRRTGYGFGYGLYYGGVDANGYGFGNNYGNFYGGV